MNLGKRLLTGSRKVKRKSSGQEALHAAYGMTDKTSLTPSNSSQSPILSMALQEPSLHRRWCACYPAKGFGRASPQTAPCFLCWALSPHPLSFWTPWLCSWPPWSNNSLHPSLLKTQFCIGPTAPRILKLQVRSMFILAPNWQRQRAERNAVSKRKVRMGHRFLRESLDCILCGQHFFPLKDMSSTLKVTLIGTSLVVQ